MPETTAQDLYIDPTPAYQGALKDIATQSTAANERYAENKADVKNIFGALTTLTAADSARITEQFTKSIADQQAAVAARTAEARAAAKAGTAQAVKTGAERGLGPAMINSPVSVAAEEGIARSNAYQTVWENLMKANSLQATQDAAARGRGYKQQEKAAYEGLAKNLEDTLLKLGGQQTAVKADIAKAKLAARQQVVNTQYQETQDAKRAAASAAAAAARAAAKPKTYSKDIYGWTSKADDTIGAGGAQAIIAVVEQAKADLNAAKKTVARDTGKPAKTTLADLNKVISKRLAGQQSLPIALDYANRYSGLSK
jgi:hypothetical protein